MVHQNEDPRSQDPLAQIRAEIVLLREKVTGGIPLWADADRTIDITGLTTAQLKCLRTDPSSGWIQGEHFQRLNDRATVYNPSLIADWIANRQDPNAHRWAVEVFLRELPSNKAKRGRG